MPELKYTEDDRSRAVRMYRKGFTGPQIEHLTGIHKQTVHKWAREEGIARPRSSVSMSKREKQEVINLYQKKRHSIHQIHLITGIKEWRISYFLRKKGITRSHKEARRLREWKRQQRKGNT